MLVLDSHHSFSRQLLLVVIVVTLGALNVTSVSNDISTEGDVLADESSSRETEGNIFFEENENSNEDDLPMYVVKKGNEKDANASGMIIPRPEIRRNANDTGGIIPRHPNDTRGINHGHANDTGGIIPRHPNDTRGINHGHANDTGGIIPRHPNDTRGINHGHANDTGGIIPRHPNATGMIIPRHPNATGMIIPRDGMARQQYTGVGCGSHSISPGSTLQFYSKNYPQAYPKKYKGCSWNFEGTTPEMYLILKCSVFQLPRCLYGSARKRRKCYRGNYFLVKDSTGKTLQKYRGHSGPGEVVIDDSGVRIKLKTRGRAQGISCSVEGVAYYEPPSTSTVTATASTATFTASTTSTTTTTTTSTTTTETTNSTQKACKCGRIYQRIVGGSETNVNEYPWQAALVRAGRITPFCGASVIGRHHVLTAAHCTQAIRDYNWRVEVLVGAHHVSNNGNTPYFKKIPMETIIQHPSYDSSTLRNDISLIKLSTQLDLDADPRLAPVCLPTPGELYEGAEAFVSGWGRVTEGGMQPALLQKVMVPVITNDECANKYGSAAIFPESICAGLDEGGRDSCQGDSGGPLTTEEQGTGMVQIGVVSWGTGCARPGKPGVYARVSEYHEWIKHVTGSGDTCA